jgi:hypothetical protein
MDILAFRLHTDLHVKQLKILITETVSSNFERILFNKV